MQRAAQYRRPVVTQQNRPSAISSAFGVHAPSETDAAPQIVPVLQPRPATVAVPVVDEVVDSPNEQEVAVATPDLTEIFETIAASERVASVPVKSKRTDDQNTGAQRPSVKKRVFSAAVFVAALVGMVAMGYDLFFAPHTTKPSVSYIAPSKSSRPTPPKQVQHSVTRASASAMDPSQPKSVTFAALAIDHPLERAARTENGLLPSPDRDRLQWISTSAKQGEHGTMVVVGSSKNGAVLSKLSAARQGQHFEVERGDGVRFVYTISEVTTVTRTPVLDEAIDAGVTEKPQLKLIGVLHDTQATVVTAVQQ